jgi:XTP/dITP diphosphohydrolase
MPPNPRHRETLVVATTNRGKLDELRALLEGLPVDVQSIADVVRDPPQVVEDGETFEANARKKAAAVSRLTMMITLADDSGLEVDALHGKPGVRSARFAHARATDAENNAALLSALDGLADPETIAHTPEGMGHQGTLAFKGRFRCVLALVDPFTNGGEARTVEGVCEGAITRTPRGSGGFGYDPLFVVEGTEKTMAELDPSEKNRISHRAKAFAALRPLLERVLAERAEQVARVQ